MKKTLANVDIVAIHSALNTLKLREDITIGDMSIYWANKYNLKALADAANMIQETAQEIAQSYFTDENSKEVDGQKVIKEEYREEIVQKLNKDLEELNLQTMDVEVKTFKKDSFEKFVNANIEKLSMRDITILEQFVEEEKESKKED